MPGGSQLRHTKPHKQEVGKLTVIKKCYQPDSKQVQTLSKQYFQAGSLAEKEKSYSEDEALQDILDALDYPKSKKRSIRKDRLFLYLLTLAGIVILTLYTLLKN